VRCASRALAHGSHPAASGDRGRSNALFGLVYTLRPPSEAGRQRSLPLFTNRQPPVEFKGHWAFASGGAVGIVETDGAAALREAVAPYTRRSETRCQSPRSRFACSSIASSRV
jgi:Domain of unknown function (DUF3303)